MYIYIYIYVYMLPWGLRLMQASSEGPPFCCQGTDGGQDLAGSLQEGEGRPELPREPKGLL